MTTQETTETPAAEAATPAPAAPTMESFADLFEASVTRTDQLREGDIVAGTVIKVGKDSVVVDIGYKSEGVIGIDEFVEADGSVQVSAGDAVDVLVEAKENEYGWVLLAK